MKELPPKDKTASCSRCNKTSEVRALKSGEPALPKGWKQFGESMVCDDCRDKAYVMRSAAVPVWSVSPDAGESTHDAWKRFRTAMRISANQAAQVGTFAMREIAKNDNKPITKTEVDGVVKAKLPKLDAVPRLYERARQLAPELDSQSLGSILQRAQAKYRETRWEQRVKITMGLPKFGFPAPIPIPLKDYKVEFDAEGNLWLSVRISGERFSLRLARGKEHHRQHAQIKQGIAGTARLGEVSLTCKMGDKGLEDFKARFAIEVPRVLSERKNTMIVETHKDRLWTVKLEGRDTEWRLNEDHVKSIVVGHKARKQRLSDDAKFERRFGNKDGRQRVLDRISEKYNNRLTDFCHKASLMLIEFAVRNHVAEIHYYELDDRFIQDFPWFKLRQMVEQKAAARGITVTKPDTSGNIAAA